MKIVVIDGQGGSIGRAIIEQIRKRLPDVEIIAVGANAIASSLMLKAGANAGASGENATIYNCKDADVICGAIGIAFANSMHGEISPAMAQAVTESKAVKYLIPWRDADIKVMGVAERPIQQYVEEMAVAIATRGE